MFGLVPEREEFQIGQAREIAMNFADTLARLFVGSDKGDFDIRMQQQDAKQFRSAVTRAAEDSDFEFPMSSRVSLFGFPKHPLCLCVSR